MSAAFDPATWLERAERVGYRICLCAGQGNGHHGPLYAGLPMESGEEARAIWYELGYPDLTNQERLSDYLESIGRIRADGWRLK